MKCKWTTLAILAAALWVLGAVTPAPAEVNPGLTNPTNIVMLYGASTADNGVITTFSRVNPNGTLSAFTIPAGKTFVITSVTGRYLNNAALPNNLVFRLGTSTVSFPGFVNAGIYFYGGYGDFWLSGESLFPVPVTVSALVGRVYAAGLNLTQINSGYVFAEIKGYFY